MLDRIKEIMLETMQRLGEAPEGIEDDVLDAGGKKILVLVRSKLEDFLC